MIYSFISLNCFKHYRCIYECAFYFYLYRDVIAILFLTDTMNPNSLGSPVGPPPPGTNVRSTATLPPPSPGSMGPSYPPPPGLSGPPGPPYYSHGGYNALTTSSSGYPPAFPHNGAVRGPQPLHSSPATQYPPPLTPNGPLSQSSPRVMGGENDPYCNRNLRVMYPP